MGTIHFTIHCPSSPLSIFTSQRFVTHEDYIFIDEGCPCQVLDNDGLFCCKSEVISVVLEQVIVSVVAEQ